MYKILKKTVEGFSPLTDAEIINQVKEKFKYGITYCRVEIVGTENVLTETNYIKDAQFSELRFVPDTGVFGECVAKKVEFNINNEDLQFKIQDKEIIFYLGV